MSQGWCVWLTGLPGSGKSTIACMLLKKLGSLNIQAQIVSIDMIRRFATPKATYSEFERRIIYGALVFSAKMLTDNGINVIIDATGNRRRFREDARKAIPPFMEAYLKCPLEVCKSREAHRKDTHLAPAEIYRRAKEGKASTVPGIGVPYEEPSNPEIVMDSSELSAEECAKKLFCSIQRTFHIREDKR